MAAYSPFNKDLKALEPDDLSDLRHASEGWYLEYKREVPNASSVAKSISAFANTYGGWLFYGVSEKSKEDAVAGAFPGIPRAEVDAMLQRIRQAVASQLNPTPHFDLKVLWGPCAECVLPQDYAVICVHVPWSPAAPHVHKSGQIYRRVADGSEPRPEGDRFVLDQLFRRGDNLRKHYRDWLDRGPELSKTEGDIPFLRLMLVADLWRDRGVWADLNVDDFRTIMGRTEGVVGAIPLETVHTTSTGFVARQVKGNNPFNLGPTWHFEQTLVSEVLIPLKMYVPRKINLLPHDLHGYDFINYFAELLVKERHEKPRVVDLSYLFNILIGVVEIQRRLMAKARWVDSYFAKACLINVWRTVPFLDVKSVMQGFGERGIPMCLNRETTTPGGSDPESFAEIASFNDVDNDYARIVIQSLALFAPIARAYGIPSWIEVDPASALPSYYECLVSAGRRGMEVQRMQNERAPHEA